MIKTIKFPKKRRLLYPDYSKEMVGQICVAERQDGLWEVARIRSTSGSGSASIYYVENIKVLAYMKAIWCLLSKKP